MTTLSSLIAQFRNSAKLGELALQGSLVKLQAATLQKDVAETLEKDYDYPAAIQAYEKAADLYGMENQSMQQNGCMLKVADLSIISKGVGKSGQAESLIKAIKVKF